MRTIRGLIYRLGGRPRLGSIWHSPSLSLIYGFRDAVRRGLESGR